MEEEEATKRNEADRSCNGASLYSVTNNNKLNMSKFYINFIYYSWDVFPSPQILHPNMRSFSCLLIINELMFDNLLYKIIYNTSNIYYLIYTKICADLTLTGSNL